jgi:leader peptidase (prepilin peptidase)/N-methyltransferase
VLLAVALPLSTIDAVTRKLPDKLVLPALVGCAALLAIAADTVGGYGSLWRALAAAAIVFLGFTALALIMLGGLGFGDCKAAALCALPLGYLGWAHVLHGVLAAYLLAALYILGRRLAGRTSRQVAFGPFLFAGALLVLLAT